MPPRRSTRSSTRLSTEPESNPQKAPSSKRKRSSGDNTEIDGQEVHDKPPSRTTRHSSSKATPSVPASRAPTRLKSVPHKVQDSDGEDDDGEHSYPTKRSRSSHVLEDVHEENDEEDTKPIIAPRTRRANSKPVISSTNGNTGKDQIVPAKDEPDEQVTAKPTSRTHSPGKHSNSSRPSTSRRGGRSSRSAAVSVKAEPLDEPTLDDVDDVDGGEIEVPATSQRRTTKRSSRKVKSLTPQSVGKEDFGGDTNIGENATTITPNGEVADVLAEESTPVPSPKKLPSTTPLVPEEKSLLDDLPTSPSKAKRPPLPLEELQGPRSRLVIHKLVLVNFKSYAGCQEIGPFHKVSYFRVVTFKLIRCSLSLRSSDLMVLASRILSMHYFLCSGTVPARCDKENSLNSYTTLRNIRICRIAVWKFISARLSTSYVHSYSSIDNRLIIVRTARPQCIYYRAGLYLGRSSYCVQEQL
jgi:structural maintenance of chromosome 4